MFRTLWMSIALLFTLICNLYSAEKPRVAVMLFEAGQGVSKPEAKYLTDRIRTGLIKAELFEVISNDQLDQMLKTKQQKQAIGQGSCTSQKCIIDLGNALECEKMIVGSAVGAFNQFTINVKMLDVVKQKYELAEEVSVKTKEKFPEAARQVVKLVAAKKGVILNEQGVSVGSTFSGGQGSKFQRMIWRSVLLPGWGHFYSRQKRGYIYGGLWAGLGGAFLWSHMNYTSKRDAYESASSDYDSKYDTANSAYNLRGYISFAFLAVYAAAITDILITGGSFLSHSNSASNSYRYSMDIFPDYDFVQDSNGVSLIGSGFSSFQGQRLNLRISKGF